MSSETSWQPDPQTGITIEWVETNGQRFEVAQTGEGDHLALCLHGFPELHFSWRFQMPLLAQMGYRYGRRICGDMAATANQRVSGPMRWITCVRISLH